jgi:hypothetical protein
MIVGESGFEIVFDRLLPLLSTSKKFTYSEIDIIEADLPLTERTGILSDFITAFGPVPMFVNNTLTINYKDGQTKKLSTNIFRDAFHEGFRHIGKLTGLKIVVNDVPFS